MAEITYSVPTPKNPQELEQAIRHYKTSNLTGNELFCHWQSIRDAALEQMLPETETHLIPGEDSY